MMKLLPRGPVVLLMGLSTGLLAFQAGGFQRRFNPYQTYETAGDSKHEFAWSRLQYTPLSGSFGGFGGYNRGGFASWSRDYPKADIVFLAALRRLTRIDARSYQQAARLRDYLLKGGFLMVDDFHGTADWDSFLRGMRMVLPSEAYPISDLADGDEIF